MAELLFEIWEDPIDGTHQVETIGPKNDAARLATAADNVLVHTFAARSGFEALGHIVAWQGHGWKLPPAWPNAFFTDTQRRAQERYLAKRERMGSGAGRSEAVGGTVDPEGAEASIEDR
jgi:hypothetical protein